MPELPEVEEAMRRLRAALVGRTLVRMEPLHRVLAARLPPRTQRALRGATIERVERRGKHQLIHFADGRILHVHFRMSGDWEVLAGSDVPRTARMLMTLDDGVRVALIDPRALGTVDLHPADAPPALELGPEATDAAIDPGAIRAQLAGRRIPVKVALLDQRVIAGVGNIYAAEGLWHARFDPRRAASALSRAEVARVLEGVRTALARAGGERYFRGGGRFAVYGREGEPCLRCSTGIERITQAGRSTYFCPACQSAAAARPSRAPRRARP